MQFQTMSTLHKVIIVGSHLTIAFAIMYETSRRAASGRFHWFQPTLTAIDRKSIDSFESKLSFLTLFVPLHALIHLIMIHWIVAKRVSSDAADPMSGNERLVERRVRIQVNTFEQSILSLLAQLALLPHLSLLQLRDVLPIMNALFLFGRLLFLIGYPIHRSSGFALGLVPTSAAILYSTHRSLYQFGFVSHQSTSNVDQFVASTLRHLRP
jgi:hypothetical protein